MSGEQKEVGPGHAPTPSRCSRWMALNRFMWQRKSQNMSVPYMCGFCNVFYFYDKIGTWRLKEGGKGMQRKKSRFFSHSTNILPWPKDKIIKNLLCFFFCKMGSRGVACDIVKVQMQSLQLFFQYVARGFSGLKRYVLQNTFIRNKPIYFDFFQKKTLNYPRSVSHFNCLFTYCWETVRIRKCKWSSKKRGCSQLWQTSVESESLVHVHIPGGLE